MMKKYRWHFLTKSIVYWEISLDSCSLARIFQKFQNTLALRLSPDNCTPTRLPLTIFCSYVVTAVVQLNCWNIAYTQFLFQGPGWKAGMGIFLQHNWDFSLFVSQTYSSLGIVYECTLRFVQVFQILFFWDFLLIDFAFQEQLPEASPIQANITMDGHSYFLSNLASSSFCDFHGSLNYWYSLTENDNHIGRISDMAQLKYDFSWDVQVRNIRICEWHLWVLGYLLQKVDISCACICGVLVEIPAKMWG